MTEESKVTTNEEEKEIGAETAQEAEAMETQSAEASAPAQTEAAEAEPAQTAAAAASETPAEAGETVSEAQSGGDAPEESQEELENVKMLKKGDKVTGHIVKIDDNQVYVSVGYKYDGIIPLRELSALHLNSAEEAVQVGQEVECRVMNINDAKETMTLSKRAVDTETAWDVLEERLEKGEVFEAAVADVVKGGLVVDLGVRGFIPASLVERHYVEDFSDYKGKTLRLIVKELERDNNKVILSQKDVLDQEYEAKKQVIFSNLTAGEVLEGTIQRLTPFGAFVDVGGIDGLVHVSEMAWHHVEKPSDLVKEGDAVKVKVLKVDPENERISLSMKAAQPGPWETVQEKFNIGDVVAGTVKRLVSFGAFVEIAPGIEGLVHISQISHRHIGTPQEVLEEGQEVNVKILDINPDEKRVSLSIKETEEAPASEPRERGERKRESKPHIDNENVSLSNEGMSLTLGERFGDKLKQFK